MKFARLFFLATLLIPVAAGPATASGDPAGSLQALLTKKDCEAVPELLGDWTGKTDLDGIWTLQQVGERKYRLVEKAEGGSNPRERAAFDICVAHLGGHLFFDATSQELLPDGEEVFGNGWLNFWIPIHIIGKLDIEKNSLNFLLVDNEWLQGALSSGRVHLTTAQCDDEVATLLVGSSQELKQFAVRFAADDNAFSYREEFERAPYAERH